MYSYLAEREQEEMFRVSARTLTFPDGKTRHIEAYRLIWRWFDRAISYEFGPSQDKLLQWTLNCAKEENRDLPDALGRVLEYVIKDWEQSGLDFTDDPIELTVAKRATAKFHQRKRA